MFVNPVPLLSRRQPLLNPDSPTCLQDVSTLEEWLDMVRLGKYRRSFYAHGIKDLEALSNISSRLVVDVFKWKIKTKIKQTFSKQGKLAACDILL